MVRSLLLQLFMHVLKIHDVKLDFGALAIAMGNGELAILFVCSCYALSS